MLARDIERVWVLIRGFWRRYRLEGLQKGKPWPFSYDICDEKTWYLWANGTVGERKTTCLRRQGDGRLFNSVTLESLCFTEHAYSEREQANARQRSQAASTLS